MLIVKASAFIDAWVAGTTDIMPDDITEQNLSEHSPLKNEKVT